MTNVGHRIGHDEPVRSEVARDERVLYKIFTRVCSAGPERYWTRRRREFKMRAAIVRPEKPNA